MSKQNKVNPGIYTQRGRLTQDDAARELRKQSAVALPRTWPPVDTKMGPRRAPAGNAAHDTGRSADNETMVETSPRAHATAPKPKTASTRKSKRTTGTAKTGKALTTAMTHTTTRPKRKTVSARHVSGRGAALRSTTKRRKS